MMPKPFMKPTLPVCHQLVAAQATRARVGQGITPKVITLPLGHVPSVYTCYSTAPNTVMSKQPGRPSQQVTKHMRLSRLLRIT